MRLILGIISAIMAIMYFVKSIQDSRRYTEFEVPQQLLNLIRQAHAGESFQTIWDIRVSSEMRVALQDPLTPQQIEAMEQAEEGSFTKSVTCYMCAHKLKDKSLMGEVNVSIDIESYSGKYDYHVSDVRLRLTVDRIGDTVGGKWILSSVERIQ